MAIGNKRKLGRERRRRKARAVISNNNKTRLCIHKTPKHMYAYLIDASGSNTLGCVATVQKQVQEHVSYTGNIEAARKVGEMVADLARTKGVEEVAFDRSGFKYHGRVKAVAEAARQGGLKF